MFEMGTINPVEIAKNAIKHAKDYGNDIVSSIPLVDCILMNS